MTMEAIGRRAFVGVMLIALALGLYQWSQGHPGDLPWGRLSLGEPVGRFTALKISRLHGDVAQCRALLTEAGQSFAVLPDLQAPPSCGYRDGIVLHGGDLAYRPATVASCPLAVGLFLLDRQIVQPASAARFDQPVTAVETYGTYNCRRIAGSPSAAYSEHATANAIDIKGFVLKDGRRIEVARAWKGDGAEAAFLHDVRAGACRIFATTLSPDYNRAHRDHLHLDQAARGGWRFCG